MTGQGFIAKWFKLKSFYLNRMLAGGKKGEAATIPLGADIARRVYSFRICRTWVAQARAWRLSAANSGLTMSSWLSQRTLLLSRYW